MKKINPDKYAACAFLLFFCMFLAGCTETVTVPESSLQKEEPEPAVQKEEPSPAPSESEPSKPHPSMPMPEAVNTFNWDFYDNLDTSSNIFYSPLSLESALVMTLAGAKGDTFDELAGVLCTADPDAFMEGYSSLSSGYTGDSARLTLADSLWIDKTFEKENSVDPGFISKLEDEMDAEVIMEDFKNKPDKASAHIAKWVSKKTEGLIDGYSPAANSETVLDIINAIYFFGEWKNKFDANDTFEMEFRTKNGVKNVEMMQHYDKFFRYYKGNGFKGIELPYGNESAVMDIILSEDDSDLSVPESFKRLSAEEREELISSISSSEEAKISVLRLPKFTMDISPEGLKEILQKMGIRSAFDRGAADFSGIAKDLYISDIAHRAKIEVDEEGSRAAAVTEITMSVTGMLIEEEEERIEFICDRPFVFVIRDKTTGTILFTGAVNEP